MNVCGLTAQCERESTSLSLKAGLYSAGKGCLGAPGSVMAHFFFWKKKKNQGKDLSALEVGKIKIHVHCCKTLKIFPVTLIG